MEKKEEFFFTFGFLGEWYGGLSWQAAKGIPPHMEFCAVIYDAGSTSNPLAHAKKTPKPKNIVFSGVCSLIGCFARHRLEQR